MSNVRESKSNVQCPKSVHFTKNRFTLLEQDDRALVATGRHWTLDFAFDLLGLWTLDLLMMCGHF